ncbi:MAG: NADP-dependent oxidoreductase [Lacticaseibacillus paracasei]
MQRFGFEQYGDPSVFETIEAPIPEPKTGQVQLQVLGFGLNPYDASLRRGEQAAFRKVKFPVVPGTDVLGRITKLGEGVTDFAIGDLVLNYRPIGGYSEYVTASTSKIYKKPTALSFLDAAALPQVGLAAFNILHYMLSLKPGQTLAVIGASGGVGAILVQLAKFEKLNVIAVAGAQHHDYLQQLGADQIYSYTDDLPDSRADAVVNAVFGDADHGASLKLVKAGGQYVTTAYADVDVSSKPGTTHLQLNPSKDYSVHDGFAYLVDVAQKWGLQVRVAQSFAFNVDGVIAAHEMLETHHAPGKLIVMQDRHVTHPVRKDINQL